MKYLRKLLCALGFHHHIHFTIIDEWSVQDCKHCHDKIVTKLYDSSTESSSHFDHSSINVE